MEINVNILSLFNGISGLHLACDRAGIKVDTCYYSEIDKYANKVTEQHYPNDIALGDVTKWKDWDIDWSSIDLVGAGFPCQAWSVAGKQLGDKDERGMLFWTTLDIIVHVLKHNPNAKFLMENVKMKKDFEQYITHHTEQALGYVEKILINSALVSAQNRERYYWTNFKVNQPENRSIMLIDVVEHITNPVERPCNIRINSSSSSVGLKHVGNATDINGHEQRKRVYSINGKSPTLQSCSGGNHEPKILISNKGYRKLTPLECERLQTLPDNWTECLSKTQRYKSIGNGWTIDVISHILKHI